MPTPHSAVRTAAERTQLVLGLIQVLLGFLSAAIAVGYLDASPQLLACVIAIQNGLAGGARLGVNAPFAGNGSSK